MDGILLVRKAKDCTSHDVVKNVRKILGLRQVGHAGTLDPFAEGLLVLLIGKATKLSDYILKQEKAYLLKVRLGQTSDTLDRTGQILSNTEFHLSKEQVFQAAQELTGMLKLPIPMYSAKKVNGKKLYELAREGKKTEIIYKEMEFSNLQCLSYSSPYAVFHFHCSKGSFVRAWAQELGQKLGCGALLEDLTRDFSAPFRLKDACSLEELQTKKLSEMPNAWIELRNCLPEWPEIFVEGIEEKLLSNGQISQKLYNRFKILEIARNEKSSQVVEGFKVLGSDRKSLLAIVVSESPYNYRLGRVFRP